MSKLIYLDAGHGGGKPGAFYGGIAEKSINLVVTLAVAGLLEKRGFRIAQARTEDIDVPNYNRPRTAEKLKADAYVSIHCNAVLNVPTAAGIETWYHVSNAKGKALARSIQSKAIAITGALNRGIKAATDNIYVLAAAPMPAALIEMGFISNPTERRLLADPAYQQTLASAIAEGIDAYFRTMI